MSEPLLNISGLSAGYDGRAVIHGIDIAVRPGEIVALVGANGAGKSTLAKALSGLLPALQGSVTFDGRDITTASAAERVRSGLIHVPEGRRVFAGLSVEQNLRLGAYAVKDRDNQDGERLETLYEQFPVLRERAASPAGNLSGGQQQMLAIGRAMMGQPRLLILDEPSLGLAPALVAEIFRLVTRLRAQGLAILLSEQNARRSLEIADHGYVIENGRISAAAPARELLDSADIAARYLGMGGGAETGGQGEAAYAKLMRIVRDTVAPLHG